VSLTVNPGPPGVVSPPSLALILREHTQVTQLVVHPIQETPASRGLFGASLRASSAIRWAFIPPPGIESRGNRIPAGALARERRKPLPPSNTGSRNRCRKSRTLVHRSTPPGDNPVRSELYIHCGRSCTERSRSTGAACLGSNILRSSLSEAQTSADGGYPPAQPSQQKPPHCPGHGVPPN
jgi:hypothetical protein